MTVDVHVIIIGVDSAYQLCFIVHSYTASFVDGALAVLDYPLFDGAVVDIVNIGRLARLGVYHGPDTAPVAIGMTVGTYNGKVT